MTKDERIQELENKLEKALANYAALADEKTAMVREHSHAQNDMKELRRQASERQAELDKLRLMQAQFVEAEKVKREMIEKDRAHSTLLVTVQNEYQKTLRAVIQEMRRDLKKEGGF